MEETGEKFEVRNEDFENANPQTPVEETASTPEEPKSEPETVTETPAVETPEAEPQAAAAEEKESQNAAKPEKEPEVDYSTLSREELVNALNALLAEEVQTIKNRVAGIRNQFNTLNREVQKASYEAFLANGGNKDDYQEKDDSVAETFHHLYDQYRTRRQQYMEELR